MKDVSTSEIPKAKDASTSEVLQDLTVITQIRNALRSTLRGSASALEGYGSRFQTGISRDFVWFAGSAKRDPMDPYGSLLVGLQERIDRGPSVVLSSLIPWSLVP